MVDARTGGGLAGRLERLDRRVIFLVVALSVILPLMYPIGFPLVVSKQAQDFYDSIEAIPDHSTVLVAMDYDPTGVPELHPMNVGVLKHLFGKRKDGRDRDIKVIAFSLWPAGPPLATKALKQVADEEFHKRYGIDYVNLGFKEGREIVMTGMGSDIHQTFPADILGTPVGTIPIMKDVHRYSDVAFLVSISAGYPGIKEWVQQVNLNFKLPMAGGTTGVTAPEMYPYYQSHQLLGLLEGLKGAAEYEALLGSKGSATAGMDAQSTGHWTIAAFILFGNFLYFLQRRPQ